MSFQNNFLPWKIYFYGDKNKTRGKLRGGRVKRREYKQTVELVLFFVICWWYVNKAVCLKPRIICNAVCMSTFLKEEK